MANPHISQIVLDAGRPIPVPVAYRYVSGVQYISGVKQRPAASSSVQHLHSGMVASISICYHFALHIPVFKCIVVFNIPVQQSYYSL
jgi:hypothetical protein